eukprot:scaffold107006_cov23-Cyclotella_meneghiniana.AAC.1
MTRGGSSWTPISDLGTRGATTTPHPHSSNIMVIPSDSTSCINQPPPTTSTTTILFNLIHTIESDFQS